MHVICERILKLCGSWVKDISHCNLSFTTHFLTATLHGTLQRHESSFSVCSGEPFHFPYFFLLQALSLVADLEEEKIPYSMPASPSSDYMDSSSEMSTLDSEEFDGHTLNENKCFQELETKKTLLESDESDYLTYDAEEAALVLIEGSSNMTINEKKHIKELKNEINCSQLGWIKLNKEKSIKVLTSLLHDWLECLKIPVVRSEYLENIVVLYKQPKVCFQKMDPVSSFRKVFVQL